MTNNTWEEEQKKFHLNLESLPHSFIEPVLSKEKDEPTLGLLGYRPTRHFKIFQEKFPAIFRFNGKLFQEFYNIDANEYLWHEISEQDANRWLQIKQET